MNSQGKALHDAKIDSLELLYASQGYRVLKAPSPSELPFDLDGYQPDLLAAKDDGGLIVEVKTKAARASLERFQWVAQEIARHPGWRFILVTLDDADSASVPTTSSELPAWPELAAKLHEAEKLVTAGALEAAILYVWSIFEAALRKRAIEQNIPVERLPLGQMLNHMYSQGEISVDQIDDLSELMRKRNRIAHDAREAVSSNDAREAVRKIAAVLADWTSVETG